VYVERLLQINMATLVSLGTLLLGMGQRSATLPLLVLIAAITSIWLSDVTGWFRLNRTVANLAAMTAVLLSFRELFQLQGVVQVLPIAKLLIYLQIILLFQEKDVRSYWHLAMLSLLQVVAAVAFTQGALFGLLLVVYLFVGLSALTLLYLYREGQQYRQAPKPPEAPVAAVGRWPLAQSEPVFSGSAGGTASRAGVGRDLVARLTMMELTTLLVSATLFFALPRLGRTAWRGQAVAPRQLVGYSGKVALGTLGEIIESPEEVMRVQFLDDLTGDLYPVREEIYLHGSVLTHYARGQWEFRGPGSGRTKPLEVTTRLSDQPLVRQRIVIEPLDREELFCVRPMVAIQPNPELRIDPWRERLLRPAHLRARQFSFELRTTAFVDGVQAPLRPGSRVVSTRQLLQMPRTAGPAGLPKLVALAEHWIAQSGLPSEDRIGRARYLERRFQNPGRFQYSLEYQPRDLTIDPIEDFIANNPKGHCEYFATALALMLRSQGIPARMVVGYACDEWNDLGQFYQVRQLHAHTWVEAHLEPTHVPQELLRGEDHWDWAAGAWLRLDPTPAASGSKASRGSSLLTPLAKGANWLDFLWTRYVLEMDRPRQREAIYQPLVRSIKNAVHYMADPDRWRSLLGRLSGIFNPRNWKTDQWFHWQAGLAAMIVVLSVVLGYRGVRFVWRRLLGRPGGRAGAAAGHRVKIEFYRRLEAVLARHGLVRAASQTPREFARAAGEEVARRTGRYQLAPLPDRIVEAFYRVRFGRLALDNPQAKAVEHALDELQSGILHVARATAKKDRRESALPGHEARR